MAESKSTSEAGWETPEETDTEIDFTKPPPSDEEMGWKPSDTFFATNLDALDLSVPLEKFNEGVMSKVWKMRLRAGWKEAPSRPAVLKKSCAQLVGLRDFDNFSVVYAKPPESHVYTKTGTTIILPSADDRYRDLPPDSLAETDTDVSQLLKVPYTFVDSKELVTSMLDVLPTSHSEQPQLSIDLEGLDLGKKKGEIHLVQLYDSFSHHLYIIDVCTLGPAAFSTPASDGKMTLRRILQSAWIFKLFCDVRSDSRALFQEFEIHLRGIKDIQNIELASRRDPTGRQWRRGLPRLIDRYADLSKEQMNEFQAYKNNGREICEKWGFVQFSVRPLRKDLTVYAANDVLYLPRIYSNLIKDMSSERSQSADAATQESILRTHCLDYDPDQSGMRMSAADWHCDYPDDHLPNANIFWEP
ncbi:hypothetical protein EPUS_04805 [Endocarpon pusillum Z07020]|uniref:3'-5' exonuclease domain-containing protein n=1 Tax=Endocarpon pusillum (strain Z07020 / HMAS-L-300199) TaxID=1263415 RepID=U1G5Y5_ENDPU|nr:uncharacterized protein EPUS_04805 [Endocarpon pusillum Z07020]ERF72752.1 hypothetical protein EPUS_04805 [Endocarpon pusillum Z07020]